MRNNIEYFTHEKMNERLIRVLDPSHTAAYIVLGDDETALLDTGIGVGSLRKYVEEVIRIKIDFVILTHGHMDHVGGASEFEDLPIYMNHEDIFFTEENKDPQAQLDYVMNAFRYVGLSLPSLSIEDVVPYYELNKTQELKNGQIFDLGGISIEAIHTPGHTPGMTMLLLKELRIILFGDGCGMGVLLVEDSCSTVAEYKKGLEKVKKYEDSYDIVLRNHGSFQSPKEILDNVIEVCEEILNDKDDRIPVVPHVPVKYPAFQAKATLSDSQNRVDGKVGNIIYILQKVR